MSGVIELLKELIAIDSVNPSLVPGGAGEAEMAQRIAAELRSFGAAVEIAEVAPKRVNVVGVLEAKTPGRSLMLCGHSDTVGVEGMTAPFDPVERDGKLYGRGAQDMKGGVAAILAAARTIAEKNLLRAGKLVVAMVADEEHASLGAEHLVKKSSVLGPRSSDRHIRGPRTEDRGLADAAIICEPTDLAAGIGHKGFEWVEVETHGVAAHGSRPDEGVDAIVMMGRVLAGIESLDHRLAAAPPHPLLGRPSVHASLIHGGRELSTYPDRCTLSIERRTVEGEREGILLDEVREILRTEDRRPRTDARLTFMRRPYLTPESCELLQLLPAPRSALSFWTDAAIFGHAGIPTVVYGPGGAGLHGIEEYVRIDEVLTCRDVLVDVATRFCA